MRRRVKIWQDTGEIEFDPTWMTPEKYAQLMILTDDSAFDAYMTAVQAYHEARSALAAKLEAAEPLTPEELEDLKRDEVIG